MSLLSAFGDRPARDLWEPYGPYAERVRCWEEGLVIGIPPGAALVEGGEDATGALYRFPVPPPCIDLAIQLNTDISGVPGLCIELAVQGESGRDLCSARLWTPRESIIPVIDLITESDHRSQAPVALTAYNAGHPAWLRLSFDPDGGAWAALLSPDGSNWTTVASNTSAPSVAKGFRVGVATAEPWHASEVRVGQVIDVSSLSGDDLRSPVPARIRKRRLVLVPEMAILPESVVDDSDEQSGAFLTGTSLRLAVDLSITGSRARIRYTGATFRECGVLACISHSVPAARAYAVVGIGRDVGGIDQYSRGPAYIAETSGTRKRRVIRVDAVTHEGEFEAPYTRLANERRSDLSSGQVIWQRLEKCGRRIRFREWPAGDREPTAWDWDGQDEIETGPFGPILGYSHNNDSPGRRGALDVFFFEFYELVDPG